MRAGPVRRLLTALAPRTLAGQLALAGIAWITLWALALLAAFVLLLSNVLAGQVDSALRARAEAVRATVRLDAGQLIRPPGADPALDAGTAIYLGLTRVEGVDLGRDLQAQLVQRGSRTADREARGPVRYLALPIMSGTRQAGTIVVSSSTAGERTAEIVGAGSAALVGLLVLFTYFAVRGLIRRAMRPVEIMGDQASAWSDKDIDRRFDAAAGPLELRHLALTLNSLLERIAATVRHERRLTAELSHELRTPLAHLHAEVDLLSGATAGNEPEPVRAEDLERLQLSIRRLEGLVETALAPARTQPSGAPGLSRLGDVLAGLPVPASPVLRVTGAAGVTLAVEADVVRRALLPVLENAWRYAVDEVRIDVCVADAQAAIAVSDDGGQLDPAHVTAVFETGFRAGDAAGHRGAGLGLALARRICRAAGGDATAQLRDGRTTITLVLPCLES